MEKVWCHGECISVRKIRAQRDDHNKQSKIHLRAQQTSLPGNVTLTFKNGSCSDTETIDFKGKNLAVRLKHSLISTNFNFLYSDDSYSRW